MKRIIMHWTAGTYKPNAVDKRHYHELVDGDGHRVPGDKLPEANQSTADGNYAAHTRGLNTGSIGLALCAMLDATEVPFDPGPCPITPKQLRAFVKMVAEYADTYDIPITRKTVLTHAEVERTLGVWQEDKWDVVWLWGMEKPGDPIEVGDRLRAMIGKEMRPRTPAQVSPRARPLLRILRAWRRAA